jgi:hypothetical protein
MRPATSRVKARETYSSVDFSRLYKHDVESSIVAAHTIPVTVGPNQGDVVRLLPEARCGTGLMAQRPQRPDEAIEILGVEAGRSTTRPESSDPESATACGCSDSAPNTSRGQATPRRRELPQQ